MTSAVNRFLAEYMDRPFNRGSDDCSLILADWWKRVHGIDPAAHLRGTYSSKLEQDSIIEKAGGIVALIGGIALKAGAVARPDGEYHEGDIGVISPGVGAIFTGSYWVHRTETGIAFTRVARVHRAWSVLP